MREQAPSPHKVDCHRDRKQKKTPLSQSERGLFCQRSLNDVWASIVNEIYMAQSVRIIFCWC